MERMQSAKDKTLVDCGTEANLAGVAAGQTSAEKIFVSFLLTEVKTSILAVFF
jgi:hypothetical protein